MLTIIKKNRNAYEEKGFTLYEALLALGLSTVLLLIVITTYITMIDKSDYINSDQEIVNAESAVESWLKKDYRENIVSEIFITDSSKRLIFKVKDDSEQGWHTIQYLNKDTLGFYRVTNSDAKVESIKLMPFTVKKIRRLENTNIIELTYYYPDKATPGSQTKTDKKIFIKLQ